MTSPRNQVKQHEERNSEAASAASSSAEASLCPHVDIARLAQIVEALTVIAARPCERSTAAVGCLYPGSHLAFPAKYGDDEMCIPCFARQTLGREEQRA